MYCYGDEIFFNELWELIDHITPSDTEENVIEYLKDIYPEGITANICELKPLIVYDLDDILNIAEDSEWPEDSDSTYEALKKAIINNIDFEKLNAAVPKLWYPTKEVQSFSLEELIEAYKEG